jgi:hypothetical protein
MPNWCSNTIIAEFGENQEARNFFTNVVNLANNKGERLESKLWEDSLEKASRDQEWAIGGASPGLLSLLAPLEKNSYESNSDEWGTKWDIPQSEVYAVMDEDKSGCSISFMSAWSPPVKALQIFAERLKRVRGEESISLRIHFDEGGMNFMGYANCVDWEWTDKCDTISEVYDRAKAGDAEALEFIQESGWSIEDLEESFELPWGANGEDDDDDDDEDDSLDDYDNFALAEDKCSQCGSDECDDLDHLVKDNEHLRKEDLEELRSILADIKNKLDESLSQEIAKIGDGKK